MTPEETPHPSPAPTPPYATVTGTTRYRSRFSGLASDHFRLRFGLWCSSIGLGSYLPPGSGGGQPIQLHDEQGPIVDLGFDLLEQAPAQTTPDPELGPTAAQTTGYLQATQDALQLGCNVLDTADIYRAGDSEREIGQAVATLIQAHKLRRDETIICTKGGYLTRPDHTPPPIPGLPPAQSADHPPAELLARLAEEIVDGENPETGHCLAPDYLRWAIDASRRRLGLETIDIYYLHNPEIQLRQVSPQEFKARMRRAFEQLELEAADKRIRLYGVATWEGLRLDPQDRTYLPLTLLEQLAREVAGEKHRFRFIQFPYNALDRVAFSGRNQPLPNRTDSTGDPVFGPLLAAAKQLGIAAVTSAGLAQRRILERLPAQFARALGEWDTRAQAAIQFNRSTPGVTSTLVGMGTPAHVAENMAVAARESIPPQRFMQLFQRPAQPSSLPSTSASPSPTSPSSSS